MKEKVLITGATGFLGRPLAERLRSLGRDVTGASRSSGCDVTHREAISACILEARPEFIYHLAGPSFVPDSRKDPAGTIAVHVGGTVNVLDAARKLDPPPRVLIASTGDAYRPDPDRLPFDEETPLAPENPYAAAKMAQEALGRAYFATYGLPVVCVRLFNIIGPGQDDRFVASSFARQAAAIRLGLQKPVIEAGDLRVQRDFVDWRDGVEALRLAGERGSPGDVYNVASGRPRPLKDLLDFYCREAGISPGVVSPPHLARPGQALVRCGSPDKLGRETGWRPEREVDQTLRAIFQDWLERLSER